MQGVNKHRQDEAHHASAWQLNRRAVQLKQQGQLHAAIDCYRQSLALCPDLAEAHFNLGLAQRDAGQLEEATAALQRAQSLRPEVPLISLCLGTVLSKRGLHGPASAALQHALHIKPDYAEAHFHLGNVLYEQGEPAQAIRHYEQALQRLPGAVQLHANCGNAWRELGNLHKAIECYQAALRLQCDSAEVLTNLAVALKGMSRYGEAIEVLKRAIELRPDLVEARANLANIYRDQGDFEPARQAYQHVVSLCPEQKLHTLHVATAWPLVFTDLAEMNHYRRTLRNQLQELQREANGWTLQDVVSKAPEPPFNLEFCDGDLRELKEAYAGLFQEAFRGTDSLEPRECQYPARIGFLVTRGHEGIFLRTLRAILQRLDPQLLKATVICAHAGAKQIREALPGLDVLELPGRFERAVEIVRAARLDLVYFWEIGTDSLNYFLPFARLAPVQCTSWGVQVTSGIRQVDYYLSSSLLEPDDADAHYSEKLVCMDTLPTYQERIVIPWKFGAQSFRSQLGLSPTHHLYLCAQNLGKVHPDFDPWLAEILSRDPKGAIVMTEDAYGIAARRLRERFRCSMPEVAERVIFLPRQDRQRYLQLIAASDVLLDPPHFSGTNSSYDGFALGKPIVTRPSGYQRGRYTWACYQKMGLQDCIAHAGDDYVQKAVALGTDAEYRESISAKIRERGSCLFEDQAAVMQHQHALLKMIGLTAPIG